MPSTHVSDLARRDSKIAARTCQGINVYNGQPCRNAVAASRVTRFCHKHQDQINGPPRKTVVAAKKVTFTESDSTSGSEKHPSQAGQQTLLQISKPNGHTTTWSGQGKPSTPNKTKATDSDAPSPLRNDRLATGPPRREARLDNLEGNSPRPSRSIPPNAAHKHEIAPRIVVPTSRMEQQRKKKSSRFSFTSLLRALSCIPISNKVDTPFTQTAVPCKVECDVEGTRNVGGEARGLSQFVKPAGVQFVPIPQVRELKRPEVIQSKTTAAEFLVKKYVTPDDHTNKSNFAQMQVACAIREVVMNAHKSLYTSSTTEHVYVFRHDGDYTYTPTISLKIGRTTQNVDARLRQWYLQCRQKVDCLDVFETINATIVERMLHLDLKDYRVLKQCQCGRTHKEWFELPRDGAKARISRESRSSHSAPCSLTSVRGGR